MKKKIKSIIIALLFLAVSNTSFAIMQQYTLRFQIDPSLTVSKTFYYETQEDLDCQIYEWLQSWYNMFL